MLRWTIYAPKLFMLINFQTVQVKNQARACKSKVYSTAKLGVVSGVANVLLWKRARVIAFANIQDLQAKELFYSTSSENRYFVVKKKKYRDSSILFATAR